MTSKILILALAFGGFTACAGSNSTAPGAQERVSGQERGGGDDTGLEFNQSLQQALLEVRSMGLPEAASVNFAAVDQKVSAVSILVVSEALQTKKDDVIQESVAVNDPSKMQILVNRGRWHDLLGVGLRKALALHEILSIAGYESTGRYPVSTAYMIKLGLTKDPGFLEMAASCVQTLACAMKDPICAYIPQHYDHGIQNEQTVLDVFGRISYTCTDHAGNVETSERVGGFRFGAYQGLGSTTSQAACEGHRQEVAYSIPRCSGS